MPRGRKKTHKGGHRHFSNEEQIAAEKARLEKEKEWRRQKGIESSEEEEEEEKGGATAPAPAARRPDPMNRDFPPSESESEEESDEEEEKAKGVSHLIEIENPNHVKQKAKKVTELDGKAELSRREREELDKQKAKEHYQRMHLAGKTDEARADLARLALIRKQREDAQRKKDEEAKSRDQAKVQAEKKLLEKRQASK